MPSWLIGTLIIVILLAIALFREGKRGNAVTEWSRTHRFVVHKQMPQDLNLLVRGATDVLRPGPARTYGAIIDGHIDERRYVMADFEASSSAARTGEWHALVMTPVAEGAPAPAMDETSVPEGLPRDARAIRHHGWDVIRWRGLITADQLDSLLILLPRLFPGRPCSQ